MNPATVETIKLYAIIISPILIALIGSFGGQKFLLLKMKNMFFVFNEKHVEPHLNTLNEKIEDQNKTMVNVLKELGNVTRFADEEILNQTFDKRLDDLYINACELVNNPICRNYMKEQINAAKFLNNWFRARELNAETQSEFNTYAGESIQKSHIIFEQYFGNPLMKEYMSKYGASCSANFVKDMNTILADHINNKRDSIRERTSIFVKLIIMNFVNFYKSNEEKFNSDSIRYRYR